MFDSFFPVSDPVHHNAYGGPTLPWQSFSTGQVEVLPFRSFDNPNAPENIEATLDDVTCDMVRKVDTSPEMLSRSYRVPPPILAGDVNAAEWQPVGDADWLLSSQDAPSPSSVDTRGTAPRTPDSPACGYVFPGAIQGVGDQSTQLVVQHPKTDTDFGACPFPFNAPFQQPGIFGSAPVSFGDMTLGSSFGQQSASWDPHSSYDVLSSYGQMAARDTSMLSAYQPNGQQLQQPVQPPVGFTAMDAWRTSNNNLPELERDPLASSPEPSQTDASSPEETGDPVRVAQKRCERDRLLLHLRDQGYSYKEIKRTGGFREAESTLRGRVRVLTKDKSQRVRRPEWQPNDVSSPPIQPCVG
jgi:hypothetical protein